MCFYMDHASKFAVKKIFDLQSTRFPFLFPLALTRISSQLVTGLGRSILAMKYSKSFKHHRLISTTNSMFWEHKIYLLLLYLLSFDLL